MDIVPMPEAGNTLTPREYQTLWMKKFYELLGEGGPPFLPANDLRQPYIRSIAFPVLGPTWFMNDWGFPRGAHGERRHEGTDMMAEAGQPLRAAVDGTVTRIRYTNEDTAGVVDLDHRRRRLPLQLLPRQQRHAGHERQRRAGRRCASIPGCSVGTVVQAGQVIAYVGDTGNAVGVPHLHFEIRDRAGNPMNPYPSLLAAQQREQCSVGIGPWSTAFSPSERKKPLAGLVVVWRTRFVVPTAPPGTSPPVVRSTATGLGAVIAPPPGEDCPVVPKGRYGTGAKGLPLALLPSEWWAMLSGKLRSEPGSRCREADARTIRRPGSI